MQQKKDWLIERHANNVPLPKGTIICALSSAALEHTRTRFSARYFDGDSSLKASILYILYLTMATNNSTVGTCPSPCGDTPLGTTASIIGIWTFANTLLVAVLTTVASLSTVYDRVIDCSRSLEKELDQTNWLIHKGRDMFENLSSTLPYEESALSRRQLEELDRAAKSGVESYKKQLQGRPRFPAWNRRRRALLSLIFISRGTADELEKRLSALKEARLSFEDSAKGLIPGYSWFTFYD